ncbi:MAG: hypothetical protein HC882_00350 [Acidobacteria bacterium]|nr:hypothetical protein [Acidobacteriota bacterium]
MYDMDGLAMYDDLGNWMSPEILKRHGMAMVGGAGGILVTSYAVQMLDEYLPGDWEATTRSRTKSVIAIALGVLGGRLLFDRDRDAAMGVVGGVAGLGLAELISSFVNDPDAAPTLTTSLRGGLSEMDLSALEAAVVTPAAAFVPPRNNGMAGTVVSRAALSAPGVSVERLGEYAPYLA